MWLDNVVYEKGSLEDERLELVGKNANYYLGPHFTFRRCTLLLNVPTKRLHLTGPEFIESTLEAKKELKNVRWYTARLSGCRLTGHFSGNDFGHWPGATGFEEVGAIDHCDFTGAILDACRFIGCDMSSLKLPSWPCFTILKAYQRHRELSAFAWPGDVRLAMDFSRGPESTEAVTYWAPSLAKQFGTSEVELKKAISGLNGVIF